MKKYMLVLFLFFVGAGAFFFIKETTFWPAGPLSSIQKQINLVADVVYKTGRADKVVFISSKENGTLVLSPPYANISSLGKGSFSPALLKILQSFVDSTETGHLFYIEQGHLVDHRLLSGLVEPILGM